MSEKRVAKGTKEGCFLHDNRLIYESGSDSIQKAHALFGGPQGVLRSAASAIADARAGHEQIHPADPAEQEIRAFADFCCRAGLMLEAKSVTAAIDTDYIGHGIEHQVGILRDRERVIKDYDSRLFNEETGEVFYKPAELLFDYLTDHLLANELFGDDICLEGAYEESGSVHVVITQPYVKGWHPAWSKLVEALELQGLEHESPGTPKARFWIDGGEAGRLLVTDVHEDNVLVLQSGRVHPIDVHFSFPGRSARMNALNALGLLTSTRP